MRMPRPEAKLLVFINSLRKPSADVLVTGVEAGADSKRLKLGIFNRSQIGDSFPTTNLLKNL